MLAESLLSGKPGRQNAVLVFILVILHLCSELAASKQKFCTLEYSKTAWCTVTGSEITCGGTGNLTQSIVREAGSYTEYRKAVILEGIVTLKSYCFLMCTRLTNVTVPLTVRTFEDGVFDSCPIREFTFSRSVTSISPITFNANRFLMRIDVDQANLYYDGVDGMLLTKNRTILMIIPPGLTSCTIPTTVTAIYESSARWSSLESIHIPDNVVSIGPVAFYGSTVKTITIGTGLKTVDSTAFSSCNNLEEIYVNSNNPNLYSSGGVFGEKTGSDRTSILFISKSTTTVTISSTITTIGSTCFQMASNLTHVTSQSSAFKSADNQILVRENSKLYACVGGAVTVQIPSGVTTIGNGAFRGIRSLKTVILHKGITLIYPNVFRDCSNLELLQWNNVQITTIYQFTFQGAYLPMDMTIPKTVTTIGREAFGKTHLKSIVLPNVESIADRGFGSCPDLRSVEMPKIVSLGPQAFYNCKSLVEVTFGSALESIKSMAFAACTSLPSITIPATVTDLIPSAFVRCLNLTEINVKSGSSSYSSVDGFLYNRAENTILICPCGLERVTLPESTESIGNAAFYACERLLELHMSPNITRIEAGTFYDCKRLEEIWLPLKIAFIGSDAFSSCLKLKVVAMCNVSDVEYEGDVFPSDPDVYVSPEYRDGTFCGHQVLFLDDACNIPTLRFINGGYVPQSRLRLNRVYSLYLAQYLL